MARKKIIAGNWKMNMTPSQAVELINTLKPLVATEDADVVFCVPAIDIIPAIEAAKGSNIEIGAENILLKPMRLSTRKFSRLSNMVLLLLYAAANLLHRESRELPLTGSVSRLRSLSWV